MNKLTRLRSDVAARSRRERTQQRGRFGLAGFVLTSADIVSYPSLTMGRVVISEFLGFFGITVVLLAAAGCSGSVPVAEEEASVIELGNIESNLTAGEWPSQVIVVTNSIEIGSGTHISGSVVATNAAPGPVLSSGAEVVLAYNAKVSGDVHADTLVLNGNAQVPGETNEQVDGEVRYNAKTGIGAAASALSPLGTGTGNRGRLYGERVRSAL